MKKVLQHFVAFGTDCFGWQVIPGREPIPLAVNKHGEGTHGLNRLVRLAGALGSAEVAITALDPDAQALPVSQA